VDHSGSNPKPGSQTLMSDVAKSQPLDSRCSSSGVKQAPISAFESISEQVGAA
jgi:hypothetical protein